METKNQYQWKMASIFKDIDVDLAVKEFEKIEQKYGALTPANIVESAKSRKSILHPAFEWDDTIAAEKFRLQQARIIINNVEVIIVSDSGTTEIAVFEMVNVEESGRQYKHIQTLTFNEIEQVKNNTLAALTQLSNKLKVYKQFNKVLEHLQEAILALQD